MANVNVSYQDMQSQANRLRNGQHQLDELLRSLHNEVSALVQGGFVTDVASGQFMNAFEEFTSGATKTVAGIEGMATYLDRAASAFQNVDSDLARAIG